MIKLSFLRHVKPSSPTLFLLASHNFMAFDFSYCHVEKKVFPISEIVNNVNSAHHRTEIAFMSNDVFEKLTAICCLESI
jgi:hypothetical protein